MSCNSTGHAEERVIYRAGENLNTESGTSAVSFIKKVSEIISFKGQKGKESKFTIRQSKVITFTAACVTFISKTVIEKRIEVYAKQPDQFIKDIEYIIKLFIK